MNTTINIFSPEAALNNKILAHLSVLGANIIYGLNYVIAKGIMPDYLSPRAIIFLRGVGALFAFWMVHILFIKEKIEKKDHFKLAFCAVFGIVINQIMFFEGLNKTTEINTSIIMTISPILVMFFSYFILKEKVTLLRILGIMFGAAGTVYLILGKGEISFSSDTFTGNIFILINSASFAFYLVIVKPLMNKYKPVTIMMWVFFYGFLGVLPFTTHEIINSDLSAIPFNIWMSIVYVIVGATVLGYLLYTIALQKISPTIVSFYLYLQPLIASMMVIMMGRGTLTSTEVIAALLIFSGVFMVSYRKG